MKILIDADACPVIDLAIQKGKEKNLEIIIICDSAHTINKEEAKTINVEKGSDSVDFALLKLVEKNDVVITQDFGLAAMVLVKKGKAINQNGFIYTISNIDRLLSERYQNKKMRQNKIKTKGPAKRKEEDNQKFLSNFTALLEIKE